MDLRTARIAHEFACGYHFTACSSSALIPFNIRHQCAVPLQPQWAPTVRVWVRMTHLTASSTQQRMPDAVRPAQLTFLLILSVIVVAWGATMIAGSRQQNLELYLLLLALYGLASSSFLFPRLRAGSDSIFQAPVLITLLCFLRFGLVPMVGLIDPGLVSVYFRGDYGYSLVKTLQLFAIGMVAFWIGCKLACFRRLAWSRRDAGRTNEARVASPLPVLVRLGIVYIVAVAARIYLLRVGMYSYAGKEEVYWSNVASAQVLMVLGTLGTYAFVGAAIEKYTHPKDRVCHFVFRLVFASECTWGLISGMKQDLLTPFINVAIVLSVVNKKLPTRWLAVPIAVLIVVYPFSNSYKHFLQESGASVTSLGGALEAGKDAIRQATYINQSPSEWLATGWQESELRMDLLQAMALSINLESRTSYLKGEERWWMIPYYPFVPRFLWPSKPVLTMGGRFSEALGAGAHTSTAISYPGSLYLEAGVPGILLGMLTLGLVAQWLTNRVRGPSDKFQVFLYSSILISLINMEIDYFSYWVTLIKAFVCLCILAWFFYGPLHRNSIVPRDVVRPATRSCKS